MESGLFESINNFLYFSISEWLKNDAALEVASLLIIITVIVAMFWGLKITLNKKLSARQVFIRSFYPAMLFASIVPLVVRWFVVILVYLVLTIAFYILYKKSIDQYNLEETTGINSANRLTSAHQKKIWENADNETRQAILLKIQSFPVEELNTKLALVILIGSVVMHLLIMYYFGFEYQF